MTYISNLYKATLRKQMMAIMLVMLGFYVINIASVVVVYVMVIAIGGPSIMYDTAQTMESLMKQAGLASIVGIIAGAAIMFALRGKRLLTTDITHVNEKIKVPDYLLLILLMFGAQVTFGLISISLDRLFGAFNFSPIASYEDSIGSLMNPMGYLYIVIVGPIVEEIIFRGAILRSLERFGINYAILVSSMIFGAYHMYLNQAFFAFTVGLILAYVAQRFSMKWSILMHIINNGYSVLLNVVLNSIYMNTQVTMRGLENSVVLIYVLILLAAIAVLIVNRQRIKVILQQNRPGSMYFALDIPKYAAAETGIVNNAMSLDLYNPSSRSLFSQSLPTPLYQQAQAYNQPQQTVPGAVAQNQPYQLQANQQTQPLYQSPQQPQQPMYQQPQQPLYQSPQPQQPQPGQSPFGQATQQSYPPQQQQQPMYQQQQPPQQAYQPQYQQQPQQPMYQQASQQQGCQPQYQQQPQQPATYQQPQPQYQSYQQQPQQPMYQQPQQQTAYQQPQPLYGQTAQPAQYQQQYQPYPGAQYQTPATVQTDGLSSLKSPTGLIPTPAVDDEPLPRPFMLTFSSPFFIIGMTILLGIGLLSMFFSI